MTRIIATILERNEELLIERCLSSIESFVDKIIVLDLDSKDATRDLITTFKNVELFVFKGLDFHDGILRNLLVSLAALYDPDWILRIDADEEIERNSAMRIRPLLKKARSSVEVFRALWIHLWNGSYFRLDKRFEKEYFKDLLYKVSRDRATGEIFFPRLSFQEHHSGVYSSKIYICDLQLLHWGYSEIARKQSFNWRKDFEEPSLESLREFSLLSGISFPPRSIKSKEQVWRQILKRQT